MLNLGVSGFPGAVREYTLRVKAILAILIMTAVVVLPVFAGQSGSCGDCCIPAEDFRSTSQACSSRARSWYDQENTINCLRYLQMGGYYTLATKMACLKVSIVAAHQTVPQAGC